MHSYLFCVAGADGPICGWPMSGAHAAFLIATFHVAGARLPDAEEGRAQQALGPAQPSPMSLMIALAPERTEDEVLPQRNATNVMNAPTENPVPADTFSTDASWMDAIRMEIRSRLVFFKLCAVAARRRGVPDARRLSVTWSIAPDGRIRAMKLEGVMDREMTACLARVGGRRFPIAPGTELSVPVPIVFVR
jgi:hypothetical protein